MALVGLPFRRIKLRDSLLFSGLALHWGLGMVDVWSLSAGINHTPKSQHQETSELAIWNHPHREGACFTKEKPFQANQKRPRDVIKLVVFLSYQNLQLHHNPAHQPSLSYAGTWSRRREVFVQPRNPYAAYNR